MAKTEYKGTVKSVDTAANTITVTCKKGDMTFMVTPTTKITNSKKPATLADIAMGEKVTGSFTKDAAGTMTACKINGHPARLLPPLRPPNNLLTSSAKKPSSFGTAAFCFVDDGPSPGVDGYLRRFLFTAVRRTCHPQDYWSSCRRSVRR